MGSAACKVSGCARMAEGDGHYGDGHYFCRAHADAWEHSPEYKVILNAGGHTATDVRYTTLITSFANRVSAEERNGVTQKA